MAASVAPVPAPPPHDPRLIDALRTDLEAAAWTVDAVTDLLGPVPARALAREQLAPARRALRGRGRGPEPTATLTRLFLLTEHVPRRDLDVALPTLRADGATALRLVEAAGSGEDDAVRAALDLRPTALGEGHAGWLASDLGERAVGGPLPTDHVLGLGGASATLARLTVPAPRGRVLDVGTGSGVQALLAARTASSVTATDTSARALAFAAFNAALAGATLDLRRGSLLDPVAGELFDLVVSNPPFVVTPRTARVPGWSYRDGGLVGDEVVRTLVTGVGDVLAPGGSAQLLGNWEHRSGQPWHERVQGWLAASGVDGWVVQREVQDPAQYAETWVRDGGQLPGPASDALIEAWLEDFARRGVEAVGSGYVVLHRPAAAAAPRWHRVEEVTGALRDPLGPHVAAVLTAREVMRGLDDDALSALRPVVAGDVTEERHLVPGEAGPRVILLRQGGGLARAVPATPALAGLVGACDGELTLAQLVPAVAALLGADAAALRAELLPAVRELVADGYLLLPSAAPS